MNIVRDYSCDVRQIETKSENRLTKRAADKWDSHR